MHKTRLGISVGLMGAVIYFLGQYGGYLITVLLAGYVLFFEENEWLRRCAVKAVVLMIFFSVLSTVVYLIPNVIGFIDSLFNVFEVHFYVGWVSNLANAISSGLSLVQKVLFVLLGLKALNQGDIRVPVVDKLISKYI